MGNTGQMMMSRMRMLSSDVILGKFGIERNFFALFQQICIWWIRFTPFC